MFRTFLSRMKRRPKSEQSDSSVSASQPTVPEGKQQERLTSKDSRRTRDDSSYPDKRRNARSHSHRQRNPSLRSAIRGHDARINSYVGPAERDTHFGTLRVSVPVARALSDMGYESPTPIQQIVVEPLLAGKDIVGQAQTGTGKTAGFGIPISERVDGRNGRLQAMVLVPTRELARQVSTELSKLTKYRGASVLAVYGGTPVNPQIRAIEKGVNVVVGTPGRVIDLNDRGVLELRTVQMVILDEADQMLDIGFLPAIRRILRSTPKSRQTALFTATVPTMIKRLIYSYLNDPDWFRVGEESEPVDQVVQRYCEAASRDKFAALMEVLDRESQTLVFRRTQGDVDWLVRTLKRSNVRVEAIHGGLPQRDRDAVMQAFRDGDLKLLVSTNLTSRGIDVPAVANVINYDIPETVEEYVHRIGRTARMGRQGMAITFVSEWDLDFFDAIKAHIGDGLERLDLSLYK